MGTAPGSSEGVGTGSQEEIARRDRKKRYEEDVHGVWGRMKHEGMQ
jgi:hypothetical protein